MSLSLKRSGINKPEGTPDGAEADRLFDADWDELVIRFDGKRGKYNVLTATQLSDRKTSELMRDDETEQKSLSIAS